jgi:hypothetical protein
MDQRALVFLLAIAAISTITAMTSTKLVYAHGGHHLHGGHYLYSRGKPSKTCQVSIIFPF